MMLIALATIGLNSYALIIAFRWGTYEGNGRGCSPGFGLCYIELLFKQPKNEQGNAEMIDGKLNIWIDKQNVPKELTEALKTRTVTYKADYPLSAELCKQLKIDNYTIKKGVYNYTIKEDKIHLIL